MSYLHRLLFPVLLAFIALFIPALVLAQECGEPSEHYLIDNFEVVTNVDPGLVWTPDGDDWDLNCDHFNCNNLDSSGLKATIKAPYFGTLHTGDTLYLLIQRHTFNNGTHLRGRLELANGEMITGTWTAINTDWITVGVSEGNDGDQLAAIYLDATTFGSAFDESFTFLVDQSYFLSSCNVQPGVYLSCPLVQNADFTTADGWLLDGTAVITDGVLTLGPGDIAAQNLTLTANRTYNAVISATAAISVSTPLNVTLGTVSQTLTIAEPGLYTATFTTPSNLAGPIVYSLENGGFVDIGIDYTCVFLADGADGEVSCIAPRNGNFDTAQDWYWYRNAAWDQFSKKAALPYNEGGEMDASLVQASIPYTMPTLTGTQYLILGYQAQTADEVGLISSKVGASENEQQLHPIPYNYEVDISTQAGQSVEIAFADSGTSDLLLDNVCIFLSDTPPALPTPSDPDGIGGGVDFGFNYTCSDVPAILAGFGINVYGAQATFEAGVSVWEPQNYIPWLAAALWVNAARPITCLIVEEMRLIAGVIQQQINEFLNVSNWFIRTTQVEVVWLQQGALHLKNTFFGVAQFGRNIASGWLNWSARTVRDLWNGGRVVLSNTINDASNTFIRIWNESVLPVLQLYVSSFNAQVDVNQNPGGLPGFGLLDFIWAIFSLLWWLGVWIWENVIMVGSLPITFYHAFDGGINATGYDLVSCSSQNFWCVFLTGVQLINQLIGQSILYPAVIVGCLVGSLFIFWNNIMELFSIEIR